MDGFVVVGGYRGNLGLRLVDRLLRQEGLGVLGWDARTRSGQWWRPGDGQAEEVPDYGRALELAATAKLRGTVALNGRFRAADFLAEPEDAEQEIFAANYFSVSGMLRDWIPEMVRGGSGIFVTVSTKGAVEPYGGAASYVASKGALLSLTRALDCEFGPAGVRGHCIVAGPMHEDDNLAPGDGAAVGYGAVAAAICGLLEAPQGGVSYLPAASGGGRRP